MKVLFIGLGSIGTRHLRNLDALCKEKQLNIEVVALRSSDRELSAEVSCMITRQVHTLPKDETFDVAFVTGPTHVHAMTIGELKGKVGTYFIEKPLFDHPQYDLSVLGLGMYQKAYVAAPMRHTALYAALCKKLYNLPVYSVRAICSSYLPEWRNGVDYRTVYSANSSMGGGVTLDLIHEWDYLYDLFGPPLQSYNMRGQVSHLEMDTDDISVYIAYWPNAVGELHLDYFGRKYRRELEVFCEEGTIVADFGAGVLTNVDGTREDYSEDPNCRYKREMEYFINYAQNGTGESINSPQRALNVLQIAMGTTALDEGEKKDVTTGEEE